MFCMELGAAGSWPAIIIFGLVGAVLSRVIRPVQWFRAARARRRRRRRMNGIATDHFADRNHRHIRLQR